MGLNGAIAIPVLPVETDFDQDTILWPGKMDCREMSGCRNERVDVDSQVMHAARSACHVEFLRQLNAFCLFEFIGKAASIRQRDTCP